MVVKAAASVLSSPEAVFSVVVKALIKMRANLEEVPYTFESGGPWVWVFSPLYASLDACMGPAAELWAVWQMSRYERGAGLDVSR